MQEIISIMGVNVAGIDEAVLIAKIDEYLLDDALNTMWFVSMNGLMKASENETLRDYLNSFDLVLPGDRNLFALAGHRIRSRETRVSYDTFGTILETLWKNDRTMYIVGENEAEIQLFQDYCKKMQPELNFVGHYAFDSEQAHEAAINEINSHAPDMLLINLECEAQAQWLADNKQLLNAKLAVAVGGVSDMLISSIGEAPSIWRKTHLTWIYRILFRKNVPEKLKARIFKKHLDNYNKNKH